jgi:hypothetical protein
MPQTFRSFIFGVVCAFIVGAIILFGFDARTLSIKTNERQTEDIRQAQPAYPSVSPDAIKIQPLPPLFILRENLTFEGEKEFPQKLVGNYAKNITITNFRVAGENAHKSFIKIVWLDNTSEIIAPEVSNLPLHNEKLVKQIIIYGYSKHERKIFRDSPRPGTINFEIRYESVLGKSE